MNTPEPGAAIAALPSPPATVSLVDQTLAGLRGFFATRNHRPSSAIWQSLEDVASTLTDMAEGRAVQKLQLAAIDPGGGKTATLTQFILALLSSPAHASVGVIVALPRLEDIRSLAADLDIPKADLCILTSKEDLNAIGSPESAAGRCRVILTTQARLEMRVQDSTFAAASEFHYLGKPRSVRVWEEGFTGGATVTMNRLDLAFLFKPLSYRWPDLAEDLERLFMSLKGVPNGSTFDIPDFAKAHSVTLEDVESVLGGSLREDQRASARSLWRMSGRTVSIRHDDAIRSTAVDYKILFPPDLAPMLILDASGRVRSAYKDLEARGVLCRLRPAVKRYDNLRIHRWDAPSGKSAFQNRKHGPRLLQGFAAAIDSRPEEPWLVISHKPGGRVGDIKAAILQRIKSDPGRISWLTWGQHRSSNEFAEIPNLLFAGVLHYPDSYAEALKRLVSDRPATAGGVTDEELKIIMAGEHMNDLLQAVCRIQIRKCLGDYCLPGNVYLPASGGSRGRGIPEALRLIFPGCQVLPWLPIRPEATGKVAAAIEFLKDRLAIGDSFIPFVSLRAALMMSPPNLCRLRQHPCFITALADLGLTESGRGRRPTGFRRLSPMFN